MAFKENSQLDASRVRKTGSGGSRGVAVGGSLGGIVLTLVVGLLFGPEAMQQVNNMTGNGYSFDTVQQTGEEDLTQVCRTGEDANNNIDCNMVGTANSLDQFWGNYLLQNTGIQYSQPDLHLFEASQVSTGCGTGTEATGPFYCPADKTAYVNPSFFNTMKTRLGAMGGQTAEQYVLAHEFGHHIQNQLGNLKYSHYDPAGADSGAVRVELQADCYAGLWAHHATQDSNSAVQINPYTEDELGRIINATEVIGDDHIQMTSQGHTDSSTYTHGTSAQRTAWFMVGYSTGDFQQCDTFRANNLNAP